MSEFFLLFLLSLLSLSPSFPHPNPNPTAHHEDLLPALRPVERPCLDRVHDEINVVEVAAAHRAAEDDKDVSRRVQHERLDEPGLDLALLRYRGGDRRPGVVDVAHVGADARDAALRRPAVAAAPPRQPQRGLLCLQPIARAPEQLRGRRRDVGDEARWGEGEAHGGYARVGVAAVVVPPVVFCGGSREEGEKKEKKKRGGRRRRGEE